MAAIDGGVVVVAEKTCIKRTRHANIHKNTRKPLNLKRKTAFYDVRYVRFSAVYVRFMSLLSLKKCI